MMNQLTYAVPNFLKPFAHKLLVSILDDHIVYYCRLERFDPSPVLRDWAFFVFRVCAFCIRNFGWPRLSRYQRSPDGPRINVNFPTLCTLQVLEYDTNIV